MNNTNKVSIIVPIYNLERYIRICVKSLMNQTYKKIEIILVNDGSQDSSYDIIKRLAEEDTRIVIVNQDNGGLSAARNSGLKYATGDCIMFVDGDDYVESTYVEDLLRIKMNFNADIVSCNHNSVDENGEVLRYGCNSKTISGKSLEQIVDGFCSGTYMYMVWNKLFDRRILGELQFEKGKIYEDVAFFNQILLANPKIIHIDKALYNYRCLRPGNTKCSFSFERNMKVKKDFDWMLLELQKIDKTIAQKYRFFVMTQYLGYYLQASKCNSSQKDLENIFKVYKKIFFFDLGLFYKLNKNLIKTHILFRVAPEIYAKYRNSKC